MAVASLKMFAVTGTVTAMGLRSGLTLISLIVLGAGLSGCGADGPTCSGTAPIDTVAVASAMGTATLTGAPALVSVRLLSMPTAPVELRPENLTGLILSTDVLRFEAGEQGPKTFEVRVPSDWEATSWTLGFELSTGSRDAVFSCIPITPVFGSVGAGGCADGVLAADEECDPGPGGFNLWERCDYGETSCQVCSPLTCRYEPGQPSYCGDGMVDPASEENCDGDPGLDCTPPVGALGGYALGEVRCDDCRLVRDCTWYGSCGTVTGPCVTTAGPNSSSGPVVPHSCVLRGGVPECFGDNTYGQARPPEGESFVALTTGRHYTCGLRANGTIACWGDNAYGKASPPSGQFSDLVTVGDTSCALTAGDGSIRCWGRQDYFLTPIPSGGDFHSLTANEAFSCVVDADQRARCWGTIPLAPPDIALSFVHAGGDTACGLDSEGTLHCWGFAWTRPAPVPGVFSPQPAGDGFCGTNGEEPVCWGGGTPTPAVEVWARASGTCSVTMVGELQCADPSCPDMTHATFVGVNVRGDSVCGVTDEGIAWCGECAPGGAGASPRQVAQDPAQDVERRCTVDTTGTLRCRGFLEGVVLGDFAEVVAGEQHACARDVDGRVYCFGEFASAPPAGLIARAIAATRRVACAVATDGTLQCWGDPVGLDDLLSPPSGNDFVDVAMGDQHGCALRSTGELSCWGYELSGETSPPSALRLTTLTGGDCGFDTGGAYVCWGATSPRFDEVVCWDRDCRALSATASARVSGHQPDRYDILPRDFGLVTDFCTVSPEGQLSDIGGGLTGQCNAGASEFQRPPDTVSILDIASVRNAEGQVLCALTDDIQSDARSLRCWGAGFATGLSHPGFHVGTYTALSLGLDQLCALQPNGLPRCFPDGVTPAPPAVALSAIASSVGQTCGVASSDGHLVCWGNQALTPPSGSFVDVTLGNGFGCARESSGAVTCWGSSAYYAHVPPSGVRFLSIGATDTYVCGIDEDQRLRCWGEYAWNL